MSTGDDDRHYQISNGKLSTSGVDRSVNWGWGLSPSPSLLFPLTYHPLPLLLLPSLLTPPRSFNFPPYFLPLKIQLGDLRIALSSPTGVWSRALAEIEFGVS